LISLIQTAEGALNETHAILQRMRELAVQSANDTNNDVDRKELQKEFNQLIDEIDRISTNTEFNTKTLLDGSFTGKFHIGANQGQSIELNISDMGTTKLGEVKTESYSGTTTNALNKTDFTASDNETLKITVGEQATTVTLDQNYLSEDDVLEAINTQLAGTGVKAEFVSDIDKKVVFTSDKEFTIDVKGATSFEGVTPSKQEKTVISDLNSLQVDTDSATTGGILTQADADKAITSVNNAIEKVSAERSKLGAYQNRLEHTINNLATSSENLTAAESRIRDVDYALAA
jgi:flagellin